MNEAHERPFWKERRVFVTGATGMVGSWLTKELLARGAAVVALVRDADPQSELYRSGDIRKVSVVNGALEDFSAVQRAINEHEIEVVFHLGAQPIVGMAYRFPLQTFEANIRGTYHLLEACRIHREFVQSVVIASSDKAYGEPRSLPYTEEMPLAGRFPYEVSKSCSDLIAQSYFHTYALPVGIARCGNIFGGGDLNWSRIVPGTIRSLLRNERPVIRSDGRYVRDYLYVKDVARAYLRLAEGLSDPCVRGQAFNFSPQSRLEVLELVKEIQRLMNRTDVEPEIRNGAAGEIRSQYLSSKKAAEQLQWKPEYPLQTGLQETIEWYRHFLL
ncbi:MAG: GDP-mannose 4,6-dehydratase [Verrucomicrobia bacterium]|nr:GDP-mannose 4,6-dehydratase [Verrucomicrobiota bacterium]